METKAQWQSSRGVGQTWYTTWHLEAILTLNVIWLYMLYVIWLYICNIWHWLYMFDSIVILYIMCCKSNMWSVWVRRVTVQGNVYPVTNKEYNV